MTKNAFQEIMQEIVHHVLVSCNCEITVISLFAQSSKLNTQGTEQMIASLSVFREWCRHNDFSFFILPIQDNTISTWTIALKQFFS